jgi:beta-lactamase regulating signal transducer with metallopeptidase domain
METVINLVSTFVINAIWQVCVLLLIGNICARLMRRAAARHRHLFWVAVLILSIGLPIWNLCNLGNNSKFTLPLFFKNYQPSVSNVDGTDRQKTAENEFSVQSRDGFDGFNVSVIFSAITIFYFAFLIYRLTNLLRTWQRTAQLRRSAKNEKLPPLINAVAERCCAVLQISSVPILFSSETTAPLTLGARKPLIILPESFLNITSEETLTAVLGHELAHIRRRDYGLNLVYEFLSLFVSFHPAVTIMKRKINQTREMACDELVSGHLLKPLDYARSLVQIAGFISPASQNAYTLGVFNADILEKRIMKLIETSRGANKRVGKIRFLFVVTLLGVTAMVTSVFSFAFPNRRTQESEKVTTRDETRLADKNSQTKESKSEQQDKRVIKRKRANGQSAATAKEDGVNPIRLLSKPHPTYTDEARKNGVTGSVKLRVTFLDSGIIGDVIPVNMLPDGLTESAVEAAKGIKFQPATKNGTPLTVTKLVEYSFTTF